MKNSYLIVLFTFFLMIHSCISRDAAPFPDNGYSKIDLKRTPLYIGRTNENIIQIQIVVPDTVKQFNLLAIKIMLEEGSQSDFLESIGVNYYRIHDGKKTNIAIDPVSTIDPDHISIAGDVELGPGTYAISVHFNIQENALLDHRFTVSGAELVLDKYRNLLLEPDTKFLYRPALVLREAGQDHCDTYRIPGLVSTEKGTLIAVYDNRYDRSKDLQEDIDIGMSRSIDGGQSWEPMKVIMDMGEWGDKPEDENGIGDPAVLVDRGTGTIWVAGIWAHGTPGKRNWHSSRPGIEPIKTSQLMLTKSEDDGLTWSEPINLTPVLKDPIWYLLLQGPGKGITHSDGTIVFPAQFKDHENMPHSTIIWSKDHGENWSIGTGAKSNTTEAQVIELDDGSLMLNMRDNRKGSRSVYTSSDLGTTWEVHPSSRSALIEPVCNASLIKGKFHVNGTEKKLVLFVNPNSTKGRQRMTVKVSTDEGMTWPEKYWLLIDQGRGRGYPSMTQIDDQHIGVLYEGSQADMVFEKIHIDELMNR